MSMALCLIMPQTPDGWGGGGRTDLILSGDDGGGKGGREDKN